MGDAWNLEGVIWMNERIERELEKVEKQGEALANKYLKDKLTLLAVVVIAMTVCLMYLEPITALAVEMVILFAVMNYVTKSGKRAQAPLYEKCDPYLQFSYIRAYARKPMVRTKRTMTRQILALAQCMSMAGEPQAAISIQSIVREPEKMRGSDRVIYYNTLLNCYGQYGWVSKRENLVAQIRKIKEDVGRVEKMQYEMILRLEELKRRQDDGDVEYVLDYFKKNPPVFRFQAVAMHYGLGMMYMKTGDATAARFHVEYVLNHGNKLYYKRNMEQYLRESIEE